MLKSYLEMFMVTIKDLKLRILYITPKRRNLERTTDVSAYVVGESYDSLAGAVFTLLKIVNMQ